MKCVLDKKKGIPLPQQLKDALLARIEQGYYKPGERIDTVRKLAAEFGVSSLTVQKACKLLEDENCLISMPQSGLFVPENFFERPGKPLRSSAGNWQSWIGWSGSACTISIRMRSTTR